jgi:lysophospholipase L1-like esterase
MYLMRNSPAAAAPGAIYSDVTVATMTDTQLHEELFASYLPFQTLQQTILAKENPDVDITYIGCIYDGAWGNNTGGDHALMSDLSHPNSAGYEIVAKNVLKAIKPNLPNKIFK